MGRERFQPRAKHTSPPHRENQSRGPKRETPPASLTIAMIMLREVEAVEVVGFVRFSEKNSVKLQRAGKVFYILRALGNEIPLPAADRP